MATLKDFRGKVTEVDETPFGTGLAERVAEYLVSAFGRVDTDPYARHDRFDPSIRYGAIASAHKEYCGLGLFLSEKYYLFDEVEEHDPMGSERALRFSTREAFVAWFAKQSDVSLFNAGNQGISRAELEYVLTGE
jgi:hypothetical protein